MSKNSVFTAAGAAILLCSLLSSGFHARAQTPAANGSTLAGWHTLGRADWRVENGEIVGSAANGAGFLLLNNHYADVGVRFLFQCQKCEMGVLVRLARVGDCSEGSYLSLAGRDAGTMYRLDVDTTRGGTEIGRKPLGQPRGQTNQPVQFTLKPDGWNDADLFVSGDYILGYFNDGRIRDFAFGGANIGEKARFGLVGLRIGAGEVRIKDISIRDLTAR